MIAVKYCYGLSSSQLEYLGNQTSNMKLQMLQTNF